MSNDLVYINHIVEAIDKINRYLSGKELADLFSDDMLLDAVVRELEIIGEASNNVSEGYKNANLRIPWASMIGMRNRLIHEYFGVDRKIVWDTCQRDLKSLKTLLLPLL